MEAGPPGQQSWWPISWPLPFQLSLLSAIVLSFGVLTTNDRFSLLLCCSVFLLRHIAGLLSLFWIANILLAVTQSSLTPECSSCNTNSRHIFNDTTAAPTFFFPPLAATR